MPGLTASDQRTDRAREVARMVYELRKQGQFHPDETVVVEYPDLLPELQQELKKVGLLLAAHEKAAELPPPSPMLDAGIEVNQSLQQGTSMVNSEMQNSSQMHSATPNMPSSDLDQATLPTIVAKPPRVRRPEFNVTMVESVTSIRSTQTNPVEWDFQPEAPAAPEIAIGLPPTTTFRPKLRPPTPVLMVIDDGQTSFEHLRIRSENFVIGRSTGDCVIPHDLQIAPQHARIVRRHLPDGYHWYLQEIENTSGVWVQCRNFGLKLVQAFRLGEHEFRAQLMTLDRFDLMKTDALPVDESWELIWRSPDGREKKIQLTDQEYWFGRDAKRCPHFFIDDPQVDPGHAVLLIDQFKSWMMKDLQSVNGLWAKVREVELLHQTKFQLGEQRFKFILT